MTDPQNYENFEYVRRGEALGSAAWGLIIGVTAALVGFLLIASYSDTAKNNTHTASNDAPNATSFGAQLEQPAQFNPGGFGR